MNTLKNTLAVIAAVVTIGGTALTTTQAFAYDNCYHDSEYSDSNYNSYGNDSYSYSYSHGYDHDSYSRHDYRPYEYRHDYGRRW